jgi:hypothetical protein
MKFYGNTRNLLGEIATIFNSGNFSCTQKSFSSVGAGKSIFYYAREKSLPSVLECLLTGQKSKRLDLSFCVLCKIVDGKKIAIAVSEKASTFSNRMFSKLNKGLDKYAIDYITFQMSY